MSRKNGFNVTPAIQADPLSYFRSLADENRLPAFFMAASNNSNLIKLANDPRLNNFWLDCMDGHRVISGTKFTITLQGHAGRTNFEIVAGHYCFMQMRKAEIELACLSRFNEALLQIGLQPNTVNASSQLVVGFSLTLVAQANRQKQLYSNYKHAGIVFGEFYAIQERFLEHITLIQQAKEDVTIISPEQLSNMLNEMSGVALQQGAPGFLLLGRLYNVLAQYYAAHANAVKCTTTKLGSHSFFNRRFEYIQLRNYCCQQALYYFDLAQNQVDHSAATINNAFKGAPITICAAVSAGINNLAEQRGILLDHTRKLCQLDASHVIQQAETAFRRDLAQICPDNSRSFLH